MRVILSIAVVVVVALIAGLALGLLRVDQTQQAQLPRLSLSGGQSPRFNVDTAKVNVGTETKTVDVPKIDTQKKAIDVPTVSVSKPGQ
jgi:hypothetical protein